MMGQPKDKCGICGEEFENLPYREKEGIRDGAYVEMCSIHCLEQFNSFEYPDTSYADWIERGTGI